MILLSMVLEWFKFLWWNFLYDIMNSIHIYLDESGDLGFSPKSSKYFVVAAILPKDRLRIEKCITKVEIVGKVPSFI